MAVLLMASKHIAHCGWSRHRTTPPHPADAVVVDVAVVLVIVVALTRGEMMEARASSCTVVAPVVVIVAALTVARNAKIASTVADLVSFTPAHAMAVEPLLC
jgi:hypothetical protein